MSLSVAKQVGQFLCCNKFPGTYYTFCKFWGLGGIRSISVSFPILALRNPSWHKAARERSREHEKDWHRDLDAWTQKNETLYPPLDESVGIRPAEIYHGRAKIRHSAKKLFHVTHLVRNMNIDDAISKLYFINTKAARIVREVLIEAQEVAVNEHNVEFKSNLHIVHSFACVHSILSFPIFRACGRPPTLGSCRFANYYVMLREGPAPLPTPKRTALDKALQYVNDLKSRTIMDGL